MKILSIFFIGILGILCIFIGTIVTIESIKNIKSKNAQRQYLQERLQECRDKESKIEFKKVKKVVLEPGMYCLYVEEAPGISIPVGCFIEEEQ